jgi:acyl CoA:acetate/3-ketoacid CoA transferase
LGRRIERRQSGAKATKGAVSKRLKIRGRQSFHFALGLYCIFLCTGNRRSVCIRKLSFRSEIDAKGNVNVSKFGGRSNGPGGFIDISQNAKAVVFMGNFTAGKSDIEVTENGLVIRSDGEGVKFVNKLQQITFSGEYAIKNGKTVKFITERAVFELSGEGLVLTEIAPDTDLQKDILGKMEFSPIIGKELKPMDPAPSFTSVSSGTVLCASFLLSGSTLPSQ